MPILKVWDGTQFQSIGGPGVGGSDTQVQFNSSGILSASTNFTVDIANGALKLNSAGGGFFVKEGANATMGTGILSGGTTTVSTNKVTANTRIFISDQGGSVANAGALYISARSGGASFTVSSVNILDASTFAWLLVEPA